MLEGCLLSLWQGRREEGGREEEGEREREEAMYV